jgi:3',5'-cyclic AMP phosphodiesterase CpdA
MQSSNPPPIAIIADAHFHDVSGNYGVSGIVMGGRRVAVRPFADVVKSTRLFNEAGPALRRALDDIVARGIRHVVLLGDYSDDGQIETLKGLRRLLDDYTERHGLRFFATPGNHDIFGPEGRHRSKRFLNAHGGYDRVTSDPHRAAGPGDETISILADMRCTGYPEGLLMLPDAGFFRMQDDLHWESPFGPDDDAAARRYQVYSPDGASTRSLMDASYLVEPFDGVWMLMVDANVFVPVGNDTGDDAFADSTDAGWNAMLIQKRFILDWIRDVSAQASKHGKTLIAFSHYPAVDPLDDTRDDELALLGQTSLLGRLPDRGVGEALIRAGINVHFSGHLHVNDTARLRNAGGFLVNVSVPSLVAFPAAYKILRIEPEQLTIETVGIGDMPLDEELMAVYRAEAARSGIDAHGMITANSYGAFLYEHLGHLVGRRYLRREWPEELAREVSELTLFDLAVLALDVEPCAPNLAATLRAASCNPDIRTRLAVFAGDLGVSWPELQEIPVLTFLGDWYRARMGSDLGFEAIASGNLPAYRLLASLFASRKTEHDSAEATFGRLLRMFERFISGLPSRNFTIDLATGNIEAL